MKTYILILLIFISGCTNENDLNKLVHHAYMVGVKCGTYMSAQECEKIFNEDHL